MTDIDWRVEMRLLESDAIALADLDTWQCASCGERNYEDGPCSMCGNDKDGTEEENKANE